MITVKKKKARSALEAKQEKCDKLNEFNFCISVFWNSVLCFETCIFLSFVWRGHEANICAVLPETLVSSAVFLYIAQAWRFCTIDKHLKKVNKSKQGAM